MSRLKCFQFISIPVLLKTLIAHFEQTREIC
jgi:hypothetical protein